MRVLAIETSTEYCSVALRQGNESASLSELAGQRHSEILLSMIDRLLSEAGCRLTELDGIAFGAGPGSFTGVRIAASVAQGLAFGLDKPVMPVCTLEAMAEASGLERVACALDARLDEVYFAAYERVGEGWQAIVEPCLSAIGELPALPEGNWTGVGTGFSVLEGELSRHLHLSLCFPAQFPEAAAVAALGERMLAVGASMPASEALPIYLRDKVAMTTVERQARGYK